MICIHLSVVYFYLKKHTLFKDVLLLVGCRGTFFFFFFEKYTVELIKINRILQEKKKKYIYIYINQK